MPLAAEPKRERDFTYRLSTYRLAEQALPLLVVRPYRNYYMQCGLCQLILTAQRQELHEDRLHRSSFQFHQG